MKTAFLQLLVLFFSVSICSAGWVDDWIDQKTETTPGYFKGQKRGYYTGGGFSARWKSTTDYPVSVTLPQVNVSCGGIDVFNGGISFLDTEYLVEKGQRILQAAPYYAFNLAFGVLCEQCKNIMNTAENIASMLNNIQINDCQAAKDLVGIMADPKAFAKRANKKGAEIASKFRIASGETSLYQKNKEDTTANNGKSVIDMKKTIKSCGDAMKNVFGKEGWLLENLSDEIGISKEYVKLVRGFIGGVEISTSGNDYISTYRPSCAENKKTSNLEQFIDGGAYGKDTNNKCSLIPDANSNLKKYVTDILDSIATKIENRAMNFNTSEEKFIKTSPIPVYLTIKDAVDTKQVENVIGMISDMTSKALAYRLLSDLQGVAANMIQKAYEIIEAQSAGAKAGGNFYECSTEIMEKTFINLKELKKELFHFHNELKKSYDNSLKEFNNIQSVISRLKQFGDISNRKMVKNFGPAVARRVSGL